MANQKRSKSIRGETVDFDLMRVKQNIENRDKPDSVEMREKYIDIRRRRNPRRNVGDLVDEQRRNANDARAKIAQSKRNKAAEVEAEEPVKVEESTEITVDDIVEGNVTTPSVQRELEPETTPDATKATSKKKIVKPKSDK